MNLQGISLPLFIMLLLTQSCNAPVQERSEEVADHVSRTFIETNMYIRERHREHIMAFIKRVGWDMTETSTGLWYMLLERGDGPTVERNKLISYTYETRLITGKICYSADTSDPKTIVTGKGGIEAGLEEGLLLLREGSRARLIIPPYLAHGNFGDGDKIPGSSILITEVDILEVKR
jgi:FKBP-type peptidyl-prolyl cis-trans isomerase FkpA